MVKLLLETGKITDSKLFWQLIHHYRPNIAKFIVDRGQFYQENGLVYGQVNDNLTFRFLIQQNKAKQNKINGVRTLLDLPRHYGINPADSWNYAIRDACDSRYIEIVRIFLDLPLERGRQNWAKLH